MCIVVVAFESSPRFPFMLAANRDERHARPSAPAGWWEDHPAVLGGRDLLAGGSWLGVSRSGRVAAVTNIFEPGSPAAPASRGELVGGFLRDEADVDEYAVGVEHDAARYGPFNLLLHAGHGAGPRLVYLSNRQARAELEPGLHVFGNNRPGEDWPKLELARRGMEALLAHEDPANGMLSLLAQRPEGAARRSPREAVFVVGEQFGTRSSTVILLAADGRARFVERRFDSAGRATGTSRFEFEIEGAGS